MSTTRTNGASVRGLGWTMLASAVLAAMPLSAALGNLQYIDWSSASDGNYAIGSNWNKGYVPGSNSADESETYIMNGHVITVDSDLSADNNLRNFYINYGFNFSQNHPAVGTTLTVASGGALAGIEGFSAGLGSTVNINGGSVQTTGSITVGRIDTNPGLSADRITTGQTTLNVTAGTISSGNRVAGVDKSGAPLNIGSGGNAVVNLSGTGGIVTGNYGGTHIGLQADDPLYPGQGQGTLNQTGGTLDNGREVWIGENNIGTYNLSNGTANIGYDGNGSLEVGVNGQGTLNMTGGTLNTFSAQVGAGTGSGLLAISGGTANLDNNGRGVLIGNSAGTGAGTFRITGHDATISIGATGGSSPLTMYANGTMNFQIGSDGVTTINATTPGYTGDSRSIIHLAGTLDIDTLAGFAPTVGDTFDLLSTDIAYTNGTLGIDHLGIDTTGLTLAAADQPYWSFGVVYDGTHNILRVTNTAPVPEPTSLGLLLMGGAALLGRKRRA